MSAAQRAWRRVARLACDSAVQKAAVKASSLAGKLGAPRVAWRAGLWGARSAARMDSSMAGTSGVVLVEPLAARRAVV